MASQRMVLTFIRTVHVPFAIYLDMSKKLTTNQKLWHVDVQCQFVSLNVGLLLHLCSVLQMALYK